MLLCGLRLPRSPATNRGDRPASPAATPRRRWRWIALALVPSGLMLATSTYITTDIVALPMLWVLPLGLYLLSFTVAFGGSRGLPDLLTRIAPITILLFGGVIMGGLNQNAVLDTGIALILLFMASVALHTQLYRLRPEPDRLTGFYLATATGGALGGVFAGLIAPAIFDWTYEFPILILAAGLLAPQVYLTPGVRDLWFDAVKRRAALATVVVALVLLFALYFLGPPALSGDDNQGLAFIVIAVIGVASVGARLPYMLVLTGALLLFGGWRSIELSARGDARIRSYFGVYTIRDGKRVRELDHGATVHGVQLRGGRARERTPTTYYVPGSGIGQAMMALPPFYGPHARVGVVGLGTGTLACYAKLGQRWRFYEIDPAIVHIARDTGQFTYLKNCLPNPAIEIGDARVSLSHDPSASLDLLALDAFSSDAIPMHLMTREAFKTYARVVQPDGAVARPHLEPVPRSGAGRRRGGARWRLACDRAVSIVPRRWSLTPRPASGSPCRATTRRCSRWRRSIRTGPRSPRRSRSDPGPTIIRTILPLLKWRRR